MAAQEIAHRSQRPFTFGAAEQLAEYLRVSGVPEG